MSFLYAALALNVIRSVSSTGLTSAASNDQVLAVSLPLSAGYNSNVNTALTLTPGTPRVVTLDNIVRVTSTVTPSSALGVYCPTHD